MRLYNKRVDFEKIRIAFLLLQLFKNEVDERERRMFDYLLNNMESIKNIHDTLQSAVFNKHENMANIYCFTHIESLQHEGG